MPVNIEIAQGNFSFGPVDGHFYYFSNTANALIELENDGDVVNTYPVIGTVVRGTVKSISYDGTNFWTLEDIPSGLGLVIRKWRLLPHPTQSFPSATPNQFIWQDEINLNNEPNITWASSAFCVEHYHRGLFFNASRGANFILIDDPSKIIVGTTLYLGPSTITTSLNTEESIVVTGIVGNQLFFSKSGGLENDYRTEDPVDFVKSVFIFNDHRFGGGGNNQGMVVDIAYPSGVTNFADNGGHYALVKAADFDDSFLFFVRGDQIMSIDVDDADFTIFSSLEANLREADKVTPILVYDIITDLANSRHLKLQRKETTEDLGTGNLTTSTFPNEKFNFQEITTNSFVNSTALSFNTRFLRKIPSANTLQVSAEVRDQFNFPILGKIVQFSATVNPLFIGTPGTLSPTQDTTDSSGLATSVYTPSSTNTEIFVDIKAEVIN